MASAQAMEEELQQSVLLSEAGYDTADSALVSDSKVTTQDALIDGVTDISGGGRSGLDDDLSDRDASGEELDQDASGEEDNDLLARQIVVGDAVDEEEERDDDADTDADLDDEPEGQDEDGDEGVGAVKIRPVESDDEDIDGDGEDDEDDDNDAESDVSDLPSAVDEEDSDEAPAWEDANEAAEDEESDAAPSNTCIFCKQDEENDPSEDFEVFLTCANCGENAHQQCARDAAAMSEHNTPNRWKCPECFATDSDLNDEDVDMKDGNSADGREQSVSQHSEGGDQQKSHDDPAERATAPRESMNDDSTDGSRMSKKRKTPSSEPEEEVLASRKRRRYPSIEAVVQEGGSAHHPVDSSRASRTLRLKLQPPPPVTVMKRSRTSLVINIEVRPGNLKEILSRKKRDRRRPGVATATAGSKPTPASRSTPVRPAAVPTPISSLPTPFTSDLYSQPFYSFFDKETDDAKGRPYGGILTEAEADTSKTLPTPDDRKRFDQAKQKAEDEWRARILAMQAEADMPVRKAKKSSDNASQIECIEFGGWEIDTWYAAPYPAEYSRNRILYICEFCLKYMNSDYVAWRHKLKCATKHPPGDEIYRHGSVSIFEVDGRKHPVYCQNLCLLAKLFLGSKTLYYDVEPFLFYILCEYDDCGYHFVGYFSKEKRASSQNNVSCILTLPIHQRKGYGNLLIDFSYLLTKVEQKTGSPEKPLSDMGLVSYRNYWRLELCRYFLNLVDANKHHSDGLSVKRISDDTGMTADDVVSALEGLRALVRDPQTHLYAFRVDLDYCRHYVAKWASKGYVTLKPEALAWTPYVMGRSNAVNFELGPPLSTIAPREEEEAKLQEGHNIASAEGRSLTNGHSQSASKEPSAVVSEADMTLDGSEDTPSSEKRTSEDKENAEPADKAEEEGAVASQSWSEPYKDIPASRFEVFPPVTVSRRADRSRQSISQPAPPRSSTSSSRPKRSSGSARRPTASRPSRPSRPKTSSSARRKTGGTGRGPGRWPKGTKKSDYGNADSGPGLPPGWLERQARLRAETEAKRSDTERARMDQPAKEEVQVVVANSEGPLDAINGAPGEDDVDAEGEDE
ncbi:Histone acetyltransferase [Purpureocillium takamizusanense]|uniref:Histone acetyltransferase n=1 Tax=Purpureocillium takamizusanense TaxID=2060973 RepID=A0A9Q8QMC4_9HYPO|nr:Histone acetyltransferase [Purpureocillium takamizusanense]UNI22693.1 Histone acetyltransferase [Purpureocillium takamizusanense]